MDKKKYYLLLFTKKNLALVEMIKGISSELNVDVEIRADSLQATKFVESGVVDTIIVDMEEMKSSGTEFMHSIRAKGIDTPILIVGSENIAHIKLSGVYSLTSPLNKSYLKKKISKSIRFGLSLREMYEELRLKSSIYDHLSAKEKKEKIDELKIEIFSKKLTTLQLEDEDRCGRLPL